MRKYVKSNIENILKKIAKIIVQIYAKVWGRSTTLITRRWSISTSVKKIKSGNVEIATLKIIIMKKLQKCLSKITRRFVVVPLP